MRMQGIGGREASWPVGKPKKEGRKRAIDRKGRIVKEGEKNAYLGVVKGEADGAAYRETALAVLTCFIWRFPAYLDDFLVFSVYTRMISFSSCVLLAAIFQ